MAKLIVVYAPNEYIGLVPDGLMENYVMEFVKSANESKADFVGLLTSQELVVNWVRVNILRGLISHENVEFRFEDNIMFPDKFGYLDWWPTGFCDYNDKILTELLEKTFLKHNEEEKNDTKI